jgi:aldose 1-epimerase
VRVVRQTIGSIRADRSGATASDVDAWRIESPGRIAVEVWTYGATLVEVGIPNRSGRAENVCVRLPTLADYVDRRRNAYIGPVLGRFARCVKDGHFSLDGRDYRLDRNIGGHHFHGGSMGFDRFVWQASVDTRADEAVLKLRLERPDGDQGYPGELAAETRYRVFADGRLAIEHTATATAPTIVGMTSHAFWNLAGPRAVDGQRLAINASRIVATDAEFIPKPGPPVPASTVGLDFRKSVELSRVSIDHCFVLDSGDWAADLYDRVSGRRMRLQTDQPALAVYTGDHLQQRRAGICLQTGPFPDAPNRPDFPSARLDPGQVYSHRSVYTFATEA